jgi:hypothetical protein
MPNPALPLQPTPHRRVLKNNTASPAINSTKTKMSVNVIIIGPPGSGVRTQAQRLARHRPMPILSSGLLLREAVADEHSPLGRRAKLFFDAGKVRSGKSIMPMVLFWTRCCVLRSHVTPPPPPLACISATATLLCFNLHLSQVCPPPPPPPLQPIPDEIIVNLINERISCVKAPPPSPQPL